MSAPDATHDPELESVAWDLTPLLDDPQAAEPGRAVDAMLARAKERADAFSAAYAGRVAEIDGPGLVAAMRELAEIEELAGRAGSYAMLEFSGNTADPARGALLQRVQEHGTAIETALLFFELEWAALEDDRADALLETEGLEFASHHLRSARRYRPYLLSEPEERILAEKALTGRTAWTRLFEEQAAGVTVDLGDGEQSSLEVALSRLFSPDREVRADTAARVTKALEPGLRTRAFAMN